MLFNGGIQKGTVAWDNESRLVDTYLKECRKEITIVGLESFSRLTKTMKIDLVGENCFGFAPDGGAWFKDGKLVAVFEAKKQGTHGNAYERWWDNAITAKYINADVTYVTFCVGAGAGPGEGLDKLRRKAGIMMGKNFKFYMSVGGFDKIDVYNIMIETLKMM